MFTLLLLAETAKSAPPHRPYVGEVTVVAEIPSPGFPEDAVKQGSRTFVTQPATFGTAGWGPSPIRVYDNTSSPYTLENTIYVQGEFTEFEHALVGAAIDNQDRLLVLSTQLGVLRFTKVGQEWTQENLSGPLPVLPTGPGFSIGNGIVVLFDDSLLVTDSTQDVIWHVPANGGVPSLWFQDPSIFFMGQMGFNAIKMNPTHDFVYFADTERDRILRLPLSGTPTPADLSVVYNFEPGSLPDGVVFDEAGNLWVTLAGVPALVKLDLGCGGSVDVALWIEDPRFATPSNFYFIGGRKGVLVNHALYGGIPYLFEVYVGENGDPLPY